ncbi:MAG: EI24 domain-containing protein [Pirellulaceae bacterium]
MSNAPANDPREFLSAPLGASRAARFRDGLTAPYSGLQFLNRHRALWRYAILPTLVNLLITVLVLAMLASMVAWFFTVVHPWSTGGLSGWQWWLAVAAEIAAAVVLLIVCGGAAVLTWKFLTGVLCGYFYGKLAEEVENKLGAPSQPLQSISFVYEVVDTALHLALLVTANILFLLLNFVPIAGSAVALLGSTGFTFFLLGIDYLGLPLALRGTRRLDQFQFGRRHLEHTLGLGAAVFFLEFIPIFGALFLTTAVVGAVLLHRRIELADRAEDDDAEPLDEEADESTMSLKGDMTVSLRMPPKNREAGD